MTMNSETAGVVKLREVLALVSRAEDEFRGQRGDQAAWAVGDLALLQSQIAELLPPETIYPAPQDKSGADPVRLLDEAAELMGSGSMTDYPAGAYVVLSRIIDAARNIALSRGDVYPLEGVSDG